MKVVYTITPKLRIKLKEPFGTLIGGTSDETMARMKEVVSEKKPPKVVSVGDVVSQNLHNHAINPQLSIVDNISLRDQAMPQQTVVSKTVKVQNPQGVITEEAIEAIKESLKSNEHTHIVVDGEEDLLTLIAVLYAPLGSLVVYGQPRVGIVVVEVTAVKRLEAEQFLNEMKSHEKLNKKNIV